MVRASSSSSSSSTLSSTFVVVVVVVVATLGLVATLAAAQEQAASRQQFAAQQAAARAANAKPPPVVEKRVSDTEPDPTLIVELNAKTWDSIIDDKTKDIFVEFYVDWCSHCKKLTPVFNDLARKYRHNENVLFARINGERQLNVAMRYKIGGYPSLMLFHRRNKAGEPYMAPRNSEAFAYWLEQRKFGYDLPPEQLLPKGAHAASISGGGSGGGDASSTTTTTSADDEAAEAAYAQLRADVDDLLVDADDEPVIDDSDLDNAEDGFMHGPEAAKLYWQLWEPERRRRPMYAVVLLPGLGDHSNRYRTFAEYLNVRGVSVYSFDLRGNGRSSGERGHVNDWQELRDDVYNFLLLVRAKEARGTPLFVVGHNLGGTLALDYVLAQRRAAAAANVRGVVALSPLLVPPNNTALETLMTDTIASIWPGFALDSGYDVEQLSSVAESRASIADDALWHGDFSARLQQELRSVQLQLAEHANELQTPLLVQQGRADVIAALDGAQAFVDEVAMTDKQLLVYAGARHRLLEDIAANEVLADMYAWMDKRAA